MTWIQTLSGRALPFFRTSVEDVDLAEDVPVALAHINRFTGHALNYSVGQHCCHGASTVLKETQRPDLALAFLLHDAKEYAVGDMSSPMKEALNVAVDDLLVEAGCAGLAGLFRLALARVEDPVDAAIHRAAGLAWPLPAETRRVVEKYDLGMLNAERRALMAPAPKPWADAGENAAPIDAGKIERRSPGYVAHEFRCYLRYLQERAKISRS